MSATAAWIASVVLAALPLQGVRPPPLQPATWRSPSGTWTLDVDPTSRLGAGESECRASRSGVEVWRRRLPFTLRGGSIDDLGRVAGYAYDKGWNGVGPDGNFVIAVLSPAGEVLARHETPMQSGRGIHGAPTPTVVGWIHDNTRERVLARLREEDRDGSIEAWQILDLSSGSRVDAFQPAKRADWDDGRRGSIVDVELLSDSGNFTVCWVFAADGIDPACPDMRVSVVDATGRTLARLDFLGAFDDVGRNASGESMWRTIWGKGTLSGSSGDGCFEVWLPDPGERAQLLFAPGVDGSPARIDVLGRERFEPARPAVPGREPETVEEPLELALLAETALQVPRASEQSPIRDIAAFGIAGPGTLQIVRWDDRTSGGYTSLILDEEGRVLAERAFGPFGSERVQSWWSLGKGKWLVWPAAVRIDTRTGSKEPFHAGGFRNVTAAAGAPDGGFVVLGERGFLSSGLHPVLAAYDAAGVQRWSARTGRHDAADLAVDRAGRVAVVSPGADLLELFGTDGSAQRTVDLAQRWGHDPRYVHAIEADTEGGFVVVESPSDTHVLHLATDGSIRAKITPRSPEGSTDVQFPRYLRVAEDGRLWTSDGRALFRLGADGTADRRLGGVRDVDALDHPGTGAIDRVGRLAIRDDATRAVHVFDRHGARLFVAEARPEDFAGARSSREGEIASDFEGNLYVRSHALEAGWLGLDAEGRRLGAVDLGGRSMYVPYDVHFVPGVARYWRVVSRWEGDSAVLFDLERRDLLHIDRRPDRDWFWTLRKLSVAPSGAIAAVDGEHDSQTGEDLLLYEPGGDPLACIDLPTGFYTSQLAHGGGWIALASYAHDELLLVSASDRSPRWVRPPPDWSGRGARAVGFSPDGSELWLLNVAKLKLWRYALP